MLYAIFLLFSAIHLTCETVSACGVVWLGDDQWMSDYAARNDQAQHQGHTQGKIFVDIGPSVHFEVCNFLLAVFSDGFA